MVVHMTAEARRKIMRKVALLVFATVFAFGAVLASPPVAQAEERQCRGTLGSLTLDNIRVPDGATCTLNGTRANGTVYVGTRSTLVANGVRINGNLQSEGARSVTVRSGSFVGGSIQIKQGESATIDSSTVKADLQFDENRGALRATNNVIGSNLQAFKNTGGLTIANNRIAQNLQCKENTPLPTGGGNSAGSKEDQCAKL
jgi:hypothetical protein